MDGLISEQQQVEEIKKWLHENLTAILAGVVIGLSAVFGWRAWGVHQQAAAQLASVDYTRMLNSISAGNVSAALQQGEAIITHYDSTGYASFAALALAKIKLEQGDTAAAEAHLRWAVANAKPSEIRQLAKLRLARVLWSEGKIDAAMTLAEAIDPGQYTALRAELLGDLYRAKGATAQARTAYQQALAALEKRSEGLRETIKMKLDDVGGAPQEQAP